jgi:hypothetical protein
MNKESPTADAPAPQAGAEQALSDALDQASKKPPPEESSIGETLALDLVSDAIDVVIAIFDN